jgi:hypothetical protein
VWRQAFANRVNESSFVPFALIGGAGSAGGAGGGGRGPALPVSAGTAANRPLAVVRGGGLFFDFNLDFGCCFGTLQPEPLPDPPPGPGIASVADILLQTPQWRALLVTNSTDGLVMYAHNTEQDWGDAHTEVRFSRNVTLIGAKSEDNFAAVWIRDSDLVSVMSFGGDGSAFANHTRYPGAGGLPHARFMPSLLRVQRSTRVTLANLVDSGRVTREGCVDPADPACPKRGSAMVAAGIGVDPRQWNMVLQQDVDVDVDVDVGVDAVVDYAGMEEDGSGGRSGGAAGGDGGGGGGGVCMPAPPGAGGGGGGACNATAVLDRPVLWTNAV